MILRSGLTLLCMVAMTPVAARVAADNERGLLAANDVAQQKHYQADEEFSEREEIRRSFQLSPGARVEVASISGPVEIETSNTDTAEVHIVRSARRRADLEYRRITIEQTPASLVVRGEDSREGQRVDIRQRVMLRLPRRIELSASSISGAVSIGDVAGVVRVSSISGGTRVGNVTGDFRAGSISGSMTVGEVGGAVRLGNISGGVRVGQAVGSFEASNVSGSITATITRLDERGIHINNVSGGIDLRFTDELNADVTTNHVSGHVSLDVPNAFVESKAESSSLRARIGTGGAAISISNVSGGVRLTR